MNEQELLVAEYWTKAMNQNKTIRNNLPPGFPEIVTLCGSTRFRKEYESEMARLTLEGKIVIGVGLFGHHQGLDKERKDKAVGELLDTIHLRKIDLCDRIHVINPEVIVCFKCGKPSRPFTEMSQETECCRIVRWGRLPYIGSSTRKEIEYAWDNHKEITYLEPME